MLGVLSDMLNDLGIGAIVKHRKTGQLAVFCDYTDKKGFMVASKVASIGDPDEWLVCSIGSDDWEEEDSGWRHESKK